MENMETKKCAKCNQERPTTEFRMTRWGTQAKTCNACLKAAIKAGMSRNVQQLKEAGLSKFTARDLMRELFRRGYGGVLTYVETKRIDLRDIGAEL